MEPGGLMSDDDDSMLYIDPNCAACGCKMSPLALPSGTVVLLCEQCGQVAI